MMRDAWGKAVSRTDVSKRYGCPLCEAAAGFPCLGWNRKDSTFTGRPRTSLHIERWQQYPGLVIS